MAAALQKQHQKVLRNLMKQPSNKKCADCGEQCAVQVDTTNGIFLCSVCSGIHRDFGYRVKSVSMASFTAEEITKLQSTNNEEFNKEFMARWRPNEDPFPQRDDANYNLRSAFLKRKYVDKCWYATGGVVADQSQQMQDPNQMGYGQPQQQAFSPFGAPQQPPAQQSQPPSFSPFGQQGGAPAQQPPAQQSAPSFNPFAAGGPAAQPPAQPKNDLDDLLSFAPPPQQTPQQQAQQQGRNEVKNLLDMISSTPSQQPANANAFRPQQGGFGAPQQSFNPGGFGGPAPMQGGFGGPAPMQGGFGGPAPMQGGFGGPAPMQGGFGGPQQRPPMQGGFGGPQQPMQGGFGAPQQPMQGGFGGPQQQRPPMQGGFGGAPW